jgi:hypothetical protein
MELPAKVLIHNALLGLKGTQGTLLAVAPQGFYELSCVFGSNIHRVLLPVADTVIISGEPEPTPAEGVEIEHFGG